MRCALMSATPAVGSSSTKTIDASGSECRHQHSGFSAHRLRRGGRTSGNWQPDVQAEGKQPREHSREQPLASRLNSSRSSFDSVANSSSRGRMTHPAPASDVPYSNFASTGFRCSSCRPRNTARRRNRKLSGEGIPNDSPTAVRGMLARLFTFSLNIRCQFPRFAHRDVSMSREPGVGAGIPSDASDRLVDDDPTAVSPHKERNSH